MNRLSARLAVAVGIFCAGLASPMAEDAPMPQHLKLRTFAPSAALAPRAPLPSPSTITLIRRPPRKADAVSAAESVPPLPERKPSESGNEGETAAEEEKPDTWSPQEIELAQARCTQILKQISAVAVHQAPIRQGECGTAAPIQLISLGKNPEVAISPPAIITCDLAVALHTWLTRDLQPLAKKHLGAQIIRIETMSSYSCRRAYGRINARLSEHGLANALDIRGFVTSSGTTAYVLDRWGLTQRDIRAQLAAEKAAAEKAAAEMAAAERAAQAAQQDVRSDAGSPREKAPTPPAATASVLGAAAGGVARGTIIDGVPRITISIPGARKSVHADSDGDGARRSTHPRSSKGNAGAEMVAASMAEPLDPNDPKTRFLRDAHSAACRLFGTTLGPEANEAHRNHFHVDMAPRTRSKYCE